MNNTKEKPTRDLYLDLLRIFATISMIMLHVAGSNFYATPYDSYEWLIFNAYNGSVRYCVPVFIMISGALFLNPCKQVNLQKLYSKNIMRLCTSFLFWSSTYAFLTQFLLNHDSSIKNLLLTIIKGHYHLWFILMITGLYIALPILRKITEDLFLIKYYLLFTFIFCYFYKWATPMIPFSSVENALSTLYSRANLSFFNGFVAYFLLGYFLYVINFNKKHIILSLSLGALGTIFTLSANYYTTISTENISTFWYNNQMLNVTMASIGVFTFFKYIVSKRNFSEKSSIFIIRVSNMCFGIYLVHDFFNILFKQIGFTNLLYNPILSIPINTLLIFILSLCTVYMIQKIPKLHKYIL